METADSSESFGVNDVAIALPVGTASVVDPEYDHYHPDRRIVLVDASRNNALIVVGTNESGELAGDSGEIDCELSVSGFNNGPEWGNRDGSTCIYYTKEPAPSGVNQVFRADYVGSSWDVVRVTGPDKIRGPVMPSFNADADSPAPFLVYLARSIGSGIKESQLYWAYDDGTPEEFLIPGFAYLGLMAGSPLRIIPGRAAIMLIGAETMETGGVDEFRNHKISWRNLTEDGSIEEPFAYSFGPLDRAVSGGAIQVSETVYILYALVKHETADGERLPDTIESFQLTVSGAEYTYTHKTMTPPLPDSMNHLVDDENFIGADGQPYVSVIAGSEPSNNPTNGEIWVISAFPNDEPVYRRVTRPTTELNDAEKKQASPPELIGARLRKDPEPFKVGEDTFIYYMERGPGEEHFEFRKAATGL